MGPDFSKPVSPVVQNQYNSGKWAGEVTDLSSSGWWQYFSDDTLNNLIQRAQSQNLPLREAFERIVEARSNLYLQTGKRKPNGDAVGGYAFTKRSQNGRPSVATNGDSFDLWNLGFNTSWELDLFGKYKRSIEAADSEMKFQEFEYEQIRQTLLSDIAVSYLRIRLLQNQIRLVEENLDVQKHTLKLVRERAEAGVSTELDAQQTEAFRFRIQALFSSLQQDLELEFNQLAILQGHVPTDALKMEIGVQMVPNIPMTPKFGVPASLLSLRPDVKREEMAVMAATARIGVAEADLYPQISLLGTISVSAKSVSAMFETNGLGFAVGPSFSWNILNFNRIQNNIDIAESQLRQALIRYQDTVLNAVREVEDSLVRQEGARRQWSDLNKAVQADQKAVELSLERYKVGKANFQRVLDAQQQLLDDNRAMVLVQSDAITELVRLFKAAGSWTFTHSNAGSVGPATAGCDCGSNSDALPCGCSKSQPIVNSPTAFLNEMMTPTNNSPTNNSPTQQLNFQQNPNFASQVVNTQPVQRTYQEILNNTPVNRVNSPGNPPMHNAGWNNEPIYSVVEGNAPALELDAGSESFTLEFESAYDN